LQWQVHHNNVLCCDLVAAEYLPPRPRLVLHSSVPPRNNENVCSVVTNSPGLPGLPHPCNTRFLEAQNSPDSFCKRALPKTGLFYKRALPILHHMLFAFSVPCRQVQEVFLLQKSSKNSVSSSLVLLFAIQTNAPFLRAIVLLHFLFQKCSKNSVRRGYNW